MKRFIMALLIVTTTAPAAFDAYATGAQGSVAVTDDARALWINPAGLAHRLSANAYLSWGSSGEVWEEWSTGLQLGSLGFGYRGAPAAADPESRENGYSLALGFGAEAFSLGLSLDWYNRTNTPEDPRAFDMRFGVLSRPAQFLSIGATVDNALGDSLAGVPLTRTWTGGVGLRPLAVFLPGNQDLLTVSFDVGWREDESTGAVGPGEQEGLFWRLGAEARPLDGLALNFSYSDDGEMSVGASLDFDYLTLGWGGALADGDLSNQGASIAFSLERREPLLNLAPVQVLVLEVTGAIDDEPPFFSLLGSGGGSDLTDLLRDLKRARDDSDVDAVLLEIQPVSGSFAGLSAAVQELGAEIDRTRAAGVPVYAVFTGEGANPAAYYLACHADKIFIPRVSELEGLGLAMHVMRFGGLAEGYGIDLETLTAGDYKSSFFPTTKGASEVQAEALQDMLEGVHGQLLALIAERRGLSPTRLDELTDAFVIHPADALELGLVDGIGGAEEALVALARAAGANPENADDVPLIEVASRQYWENEWGNRPRIAVIGAYGSIAVGRSSYSIVDGSKVMGSQTIAAELDDARRDPLVRAVVLRIDSGGGSGIASDEIARAVERCTANGKPVIASMGDVAASGGYWIACPADFIYASGSTYTGSIGVVGVLPSLERLFEEKGVVREVYQKGKSANLGDIGHRLTDEERAAYESELAYFYDIFINLVAESRGMDPEAVRAVAGGRVWTGSEALENGLVDGLGGLREAVELARREGGIEHPDPDLATYYSFGSVIFKRIGGYLSDLFGLGPFSEFELEL
ncbi:MAG TPA: signal peptide peptidase SppA [bacterium]|nr:signal peptide peptidase SppA [bacterium]